METVIINYQAGNTRSVMFALERLGVNAVLTDDREVIRSAGRVILPGVGHAKAAMTELQKRGLDLVIPELQQPFLGICLGQQLLCAHSEEGDTACLDIFPLQVKRFEILAKVPQMGWNRIYDTATPLFDGIGDDSWMYHVHSYYVPMSEYNVATCKYEVEFATAIRKNNFYGVQFHPEKSGEAGARLLSNFLQLKP